MVLGHELIHFIHKKFGLHFGHNPSAEEENTVQGLIERHDGKSIDNSLIHVIIPRAEEILDDEEGQDWKLTENQFRYESHVPIRNGYDSVPVCSAFEMGGCELFNQYGDDTCRILQTSDDERIKKIRNRLMNKH